MKPAVQTLPLVVALALLVGQAAPPPQLPPASTQIAGAKKKATEQILLSARSKDPFLRANAIEAIGTVPDRARPMAQLALKDPHPAVRFAAATTVGRLKLDGMGPAIREAVKDADPSVRAAALFAATQLNLGLDVSELASLLGSDDPGVRANTAMLLGLMKDTGARAMMREIGERPLPRNVPTGRQSLYRIQLAEAMVQLGDEGALEAIRAGAYSSFDEVRILSVQAMGRLRDRRMEPALVRIQNDGPIQLRLAAAQALAQMGAPVNTGMVLKAAAYGHEQAMTDAQEMAKRGGEPQDRAYVDRLVSDGNMRQDVAGAVRAQAAFVLGLLDNPQTAAKLVSMLDDPAESTRLATAAAVLRFRPFNEPAVQ